MSHRYSCEFCPPYFPRFVVLTLGVTLLLIPAVGPNLAKVPLGTGDRLVLPINHKERHIIALVRLGLPGGIDPDRTDHLDAVPALTIAQHFGIDVPPIQQMFLGQQAFADQSGVDRSVDLFILGGGGRGFHVGNQMGLSLITTLGQVDLITNPLGLRF